MLFVPVGENITMSVDEVKEFIRLVNPRIVVPMHYRVGGLSIPLTPLDSFLALVPEEAVEYVGNEIDLLPEDFSDIKECWIFTR